MSNGGPEDVMAQWLMIVCVVIIILSVASALSEIL